MKERARSLVEIFPDEVVTVRRILFECLQTHCGELGVHEGDRLSVVGGDTRALLLRRTDGRLIRCPPEFARFVEVTPSPRARPPGPATSQRGGTQASNRSHGP